MFWIKNMKVSEWARLRKKYRTQFMLTINGTQSKYDCHINDQNAMWIKFHDHSWLFHQLRKKTGSCMGTCFSGRCLCWELAVTERFKQEAIYGLSTGTKISGYCIVGSWSLVGGSTVLWDQQLSSRTRCHINYQHQKNYQILLQYNSYYFVRFFSISESCMSVCYLTNNKMT